MSIHRLTSFGNEEDEIAGNGKKKNKKAKSAYEEGIEGWEIVWFWIREITVYNNNGVLSLLIFDKNRNDRIKK